MQGFIAGARWSNLNHLDYWSNLIRDGGIDADGNYIDINIDITF